MNNASQKARLLRRRSGFSLVEMIGVLAIIAILAVIIVPKVFSTINSSRITSAVAATNAFKTAVTDFYSRYNRLPIANAGTLRFDDVLVKAGIVDSRFTAKIGTPPSNTTGATWTLTNGWTATAGGTSQANQSRIISNTYAAGAPSTVPGRNYYLNTNGVGLPAGSTIVSAVLMQVKAADAIEINQRIDGDTFPAPAAGTADDNGKVVFAAPAANGLTNVYVYLVHQ